MIDTIIGPDESVQGFPVQVIQTVVIDRGSIETRFDFLDPSIDQDHRIDDRTDL